METNEGNYKEERRESRLIDNLKSRHSFTMSDGHPSQLSDFQTFVSIKRSRPKDGL